MQPSPTRPAAYNARALVLGPALCSPISNPQCQVCKKEGALLRCDRCSRSFHLVCVSLCEAQLPVGYWYCRRCWADYEAKLNEDMDRLEKRQKLRKEKLIRKFLKHAETVDLHKLISKGDKTKKRPNVENTLLAITSDVLPQAEDPQPGKNIPSLLIFIADFCYSFRDLLLLPVFSLAQLDTELQQSAESPLLTKIIAGALKVIVRHMFARHGTNECIPARCAYLSLAFQTHGLYSPLEQLEVSYFPFLTELLTCPMWSGYIAPGSSLAIVVGRMQDCPFEGYFNVAYGYQEKAEVIYWLTQCLLDCPELGDTVRKITAQKPALEQKLRELKKAKDESKREEKIAQVKAQLRDTNCVTKPFASINGSELYCFAFDPRTICLRTYTETTEQWQVFQTRRDLNKLAALDSPYCKRKLLSLLKLVDSSQVQPLDIPRPCSLTYLIQVLVLFEARLRLYLQHVQKQWETPENTEGWIKRVKTAQTVPELKWLLLEVAQKGNLAVKPNSLKSHYKKTIWATPEFKEKWEKLLENVIGQQELLLLALYCAAHWRHFALKKETGDKYFPADLFKPNERGTGLEFESLSNVEIVAIEFPIKCENAENESPMDCEKDEAEPMKVEEEAKSMPIPEQRTSELVKVKVEDIVMTEKEKPHAKEEFVRLGPRTRSRRDEPLRVLSEADREIKYAPIIASVPIEPHSDSFSESASCESFPEPKSHKKSGHSEDSAPRLVEATSPPTGASHKPRIFFVFQEHPESPAQDAKDNSPEATDRQKRNRTEPQVRRSTRINRGKLDK